MRNDVIRAIAFRPPLTAEKHLAELTSGVRSGTAHPVLWYSRHWRPVASERETLSLDGCVAKQIFD